MQRIPLSDLDMGYLVGREGATRIRLEQFSGARINIDKDAAEVCVRLGASAFSSCVFVPLPL